MNGDVSGLVSVLVPVLVSVLFQFARELEISSSPLRTSSP